jgi:hypothetical protein
MPTKSKTDRAVPLQTWSTKKMRLFGKSILKKIESYKFNLVRTHCSQLSVLVSCKISGTLYEPFFIHGGRNRCVNLTFLARLAGHTSGSFEISRQGSLSFSSPGFPRAICQKSCRSDENSPARDVANIADLSAREIRYPSARKVHFATSLPTAPSINRVGIWQTCRTSPPVAIPRKRCRSVCKKKFGGWG